MEALKFNAFAKRFEPHAWRERDGLQRCGYCGSVSPADLATGLRAGASLELADMKYGWPHKFYVHKSPLPLGHGKFYTEHLKDATAEDREVIERAAGIRFNFTPSGGVSWEPFV